MMRVNSSRLTCACGLAACVPVVLIVGYCARAAAQAGAGSASASGSPAPRARSAAVAPRLMGQRPLKLLYEDYRLRTVTQVKVYSDDSQVFHGDYVEYYRSGKEFCTGQYRDGRRESQWVFYHSNGKEAKKGQYASDKPMGKWSYWSLDGQLVREESYQEGLPHGAWIYYDRDGKTPPKTIQFDRGRQVPDQAS